jgi:hypothetical protein
LEFTPSLAFPAWQPVPNAPVLSQSMYQVQISSSAPAGFYRLRF